MQAKLDVWKTETSYKYDQREYPFLTTEVFDAIWIRSRTELIQPCTDITEMLVAC